MATAASIGSPSGMAVTWMASATASSAMPPQSSTAKTRVPGAIATPCAASMTVPATSVPGTKGRGGRR